MRPTNWLDAHPDAPQLPADIGDRLGKARDELLRAEQLLERKRDAIGNRSRSNSPDAIRRGH